MKKEVELSDFVIIAIVSSTILALLKTFNIISSWWIVPIPFAIMALILIVIFILALIDEFRY